MLQLIRRPRWIGLLALVLVLSTAFVLLGRWQWHRHASRDAANAVIETNTALAPQPVDTVLAVGAPPRADQLWTTVRASGTYLGEDEVLVRNQVVDGRSGYDVLTPLRTDAGTVLWVVRGWIPAGGTASAPSAWQPPPTGEVTVDGRVRPAQVASRGLDAGVPGQVTAVDVAALGERTGTTAYDGYVELTAQDPAPAADLVALPAPEVSAGPHLAYAVQWWLFAVISVGGYVLLLRREAADERAAAGGAAGGTPDDGLDDDDPGPRPAGHPLAGSGAGGGQEPPRGL